MNPWTDSFEQYRQDILGEDKKKSDKQTKQRWQDDDGDGDWYEKSDVDGKISDREKKEKEKNSKKEVKEEGIADIIARLEKKRISKGGDPDESPLPSMKKYHEKKKKKVKEEVVAERHVTASMGRHAKKWREAQAAQKDREDNAKWEEKARTHKWDGKTWNKRDKPTHDEGQGPHAKKLASHNAKNESVEVNHIDGSTTQIIDIVRAPAMVAAPKFSNWKEEMSYEALKGEKLDIEAEKGKVKNQVDINPTIKTEEKKNLDEVKIKYYSGQDRNPNTGLPKGLKASPVRTEKEVNKKLDRTTLAQSYDPEGEMIVDEEVGVSSSASMKKARDEAELQRREALAKKKKGVKEDVVDEGLGKLIDKGITGAFNTADKVSSAMDKNPVGRFVKGAAKTVFGPNKGNPGKNYPTAADQKAKGLRTTLGNSYEPEGELIDEKKKGLDGKACWDGYKLAGTKKKGGKTVDNCVKEGDYHSGQGEKKQKRTLAWMRKKGQKGAPGLDAYKERQKDHEDKRGKKKVNEAELDERLGGKGYSRKATGGGGDWEDSDRGAGNKAKKRAGGTVKKKSPTYLAHVHNKEEVQVDEAKVDKGRSDYGKASIRNYRRFGPGHGEPAMFDPENKRGKAIDKRREEGKERRGKKKAKVPAYKVDEAIGLDERLGGKGYKPRKDSAGRRVSGDWENSDRGGGHKSKKRAGGEVEKKSPTYLAYVKNKKKKVEEGLGTVGAIAGTAAIAGMGFNAIRNMQKNKKTMDSGGSFKKGSTMDNIQKKNNMLKQLQNQSYEPEGEVLEATKYSKVKGKNYKSGKKSVKGGTAKGDLAYKTALANIIKQVGAGGVQQSSKQGKKKKGEKGMKQIGDRKFSPAETIRRRKASAKAAYAAMTDTRGT